MLAKIKKLWAQLKKTHSTPAEVAGGFALGIFVGMSPIPFHTVWVLILAFLFRVNPIASVVGVHFHLIFLPILPIQYVLEYRLGNFILGRHAPDNPKIDWPALHSLEFWRQGGLKQVITEILAGWLAIGVPVSLIVFFFVLREAKLWGQTPPFDDRSEGAD